MLRSHTDLIEERVVQMRYDRYHLDHIQWTLLYDPLTAVCLILIIKRHLQKKCIHRKKQKLSRTGLKPTSAGRESRSSLLYREISNWASTTASLRNITRVHLPQSAHLKKPLEKQQILATTKKKKSFMTATRTWTTFSRSQVERFPPRPPLTLV